MKKLFQDAWRVCTRVNKKVVLLLGLAVVVALAGCSSSTTGQGKKSDTVELKLAHFFPSTHPAETQLIQPWAKAVEEATGGKVKIVSYPGETLLKADGVYDGVVTGIADIGLSCFSYTRGVFPVLEAFELPGVIYNRWQCPSPKPMKLYPRELLRVTWLRSRCCRVGNMLR